LWWFSGEGRMGQDRGEQEDGPDESHVWWILPSRRSRRWAWDWSGLLRL
jgi:hypothetical protein